MIYYVYKITNLINNMYYIGVHQTEHPNHDRYMGSGKYVRAAIKKYGVKMFKKEILKNFETRSDAFLYEKMLVTADVVADENCYNLIPGGRDSYNHSRNGIEQATLARSKTKYVYVYKNDITKSIPLDVLDIYLQRGWCRGNLSLSRTMKGKKISKEHKDKISSTLTGTCIVYNSMNKHKRIQKHELSKYILDDWKSGISDFYKNQRKQSGRYNKSGNKNGSFGKRLINNPDTGQHKRVENVDDYIKAGWEVGWSKSPELRRCFASRSKTPS